MTKQVLMTALLFCVADFGQGQGPTQTVPIVGARFEIIQSALAARETFKLDRFAGEVYMLVEKSENGEVFWALTNWRDRPAAITATAPRFQIFLGGQRVSDMFLLDSTTGKTWIWAIVRSEPPEPAVKGVYTPQLPGSDINDLAWVPMRNLVVR
jgi:hypothetical protein